MPILKHNSAPVKAACTLLFAGLVAGCGIKDKANEALTCPDWVAPIVGYDTGFAAASDVAVTAAIDNFPEMWAGVAINKTELSRQMSISLGQAALPLADRFSKEVQIHKEECTTSVPLSATLEGVAMCDTSGNPNPGAATKPYHSALAVDMVFEYGADGSLEFTGAQASPNDLGVGKTAENWVRECQINGGVPGAQVPVLAVG